MHHVINICYGFEGTRSQVDNMVMEDEIHIGFFTVPRVANHREYEGPARAGLAGASAAAAAS